MAKAKRPLPIRRVLDAVAGARLCYGEPVVAGDRAVIPVARLSTAGGYGFGSGNDPEGEGSGGGGGGWLEAKPVGFIEVGPAGARYEKIPDPERVARNLKAGAAAASAVVAAVLGARRLAEGRRGARLNVGRSLLEKAR